MNVYNVEKIIDERIKKNGEIQYLIKWEGYSSDDNSWERESNLFCPELIAEFKSRHKPNKSKHALKRKIDTANPEKDGSQEPEENYQPPKSKKKKKNIKSSQLAQSIESKENISPNTVNSGQEIEVDSSPRTQSENFLELQVTEKTLDVDDVTDKYNRTEIIEMEPEKHESKFILYNHIRKLKWKRTEKVIHHFFRCTSCKKILNINTRTHYATLKRHLNKCCKIELTKGEKEIKITDVNLRNMLEAMIEIGNEFGSVDITAIELPHIYSKSECERSIGKIRDLAQKNGEKATEIEPIITSLEQKDSDH